MSIAYEELLKRAAHCRSKGAFGEARSIYTEATKHAPQRVEGYLSWSRMERSLHSFSSAETIVRHGLNHLQHNHLLVCELGEALWMQGKREDAETLFESAFTRGYKDVDAHIRYLRLLGSTSKFSRLLKHRRDMDLSNATEAQLAAIDHISGMAKVSGACDRKAGIGYAHNLVAQGRWRTTEAMSTALQAVIKSGKPYSMIRLGDGEGRIMAYLDRIGPPDLSERERFAVGQSIWRNWFDSSLAHEQPSKLKALHKDLYRSIKNSDAIGITTPNRLSMSHEHFAYLDYINKISSSKNKKSILCDSLIFFEMHKIDPFYRQILSSLDFIGFVGPHPDLIQRYAQLLEIRKYISYLIPGEMRLPDRDGLSKGVGHFPTRYSEILKEITVPFRGAVFLIAAGLLGKIYCNKIKEKGGIAIDIGSVADGWSGINTRPGFLEKREEWLLPALQQ